MSERSAVVVGAGVGGLATAVALTASGWRVQVLERHERLRADDAGLQLWANGVRALQALGMGGALEAIADRRSRGPAGLRAPDGKWLVRPDKAAGESAFVHRRDLHEALVAALGDTVTVRTSATVTGLRLGDAPAVRLGGESVSADLVVGADGAGSLARTTVDNHARLVGAGRVAWRAVVPSFRAPEVRGVAETQGDGLRFTYADLGHNGVYWTAEAQGSVRPESPAGQLDLLRRWFTGWHEPVGLLIAATRPEELTQTPVEYLDPLPGSFAHTGAHTGVALVGDAAHALTTDLGQGAGLALEDAVTLGACLRGRTVPEGLRRYDELRRHRVTRLAKLSRRAGESFAPRGRLRSALARAMPDRSHVKGAPAVTDWDPPAG